MSLSSTTRQRVPDQCVFFLLGIIQVAAAFDMTEIVQVESHGTSNTPQHAACC